MELKALKMQASHHVKQEKRQPVTPDTLKLVQLTAEIVLLRLPNEYLQVSDHVINSMIWR